LQILPSLNSKQLRLLFHGRRHFTGRKDFTIHLIFTGGKDFTIRLISTGRKDFTISLIFTGRKDFTIRLIFLHFAGAYIFVYFICILI
jgi:hypothetical protein